MSFIKRLFQRMNMHHSTAFAAQMAYFFFLSIFPFIIVFVTIGGAMFDIQEVALWLQDWHWLPITIKDLILQFFSKANDQQVSIVSVSFITIVWSTSKAYYALSHALGIASGEKGSPNYWLERLKGLVYTSLLILALVLGVLLPAISETVVDRVITLLRWPMFWSRVVIIIKWITYVVMLFMVLGGTYYAIPSRKASYLTVVPGTLFTIVAWYVIALIFNTVILKFAQFSLVYGTLASVAVAMLWLHAMSSAMIMGAEINAMVSQKYFNKGV